MESKLAEDVLLACGAVDNRHYMVSLDRLIEKFTSALPPNYEKAMISPAAKVFIGKELFEFLVKLRPKRYQSDSHLLTRLLDVYNSDDQNASGGNCIALTALYNIIAESFDIPTFTILLDSHILSRIKTGGIVVNVEHTIPTGFGVNEIQRRRDEHPIDLSQLPSFHNRAIVAETYYTTAEELYHMGDYDASWELNEKAISIYPQQAHYKLRNMLRGMGD